MSVTYGKASPNDYEEVLDLASLVFSYAYSPHRFVEILPKLYLPERFDPACHYVAKEDGRIKAVIGAYRMDYHVCGQTLRASGIGMVSVHHNRRSKGYMKTLMDMALEDMRRGAIDLSCLGGQRQRYEYFGYTPCGTALAFNCTQSNLRHAYGDKVAAVTLEEVGPEASDTLDTICRMHHAAKAHIIRPRASLADVLRSWGNKTISVWENGTLRGYYVTSAQQDRLCELHLDDPALIPGVIHAHLSRYDRYEVSALVFPQEPAFVTAFSAFAEGITVRDAYNFNIFNYPQVLSAFLKLKGAVSPLPEGSLTVCVKGVGRLRIAVKDQIPSVTETDDPPALTLSHTQAMRLFFSPTTAFDYNAAPNDFARQLFPLPLFIDESDKI